MSGFLFSAVAFVFALGILITVHEFGHYWVARKAGVKVLRFSIGFGKPLWTRRLGPDQTEFVLAAIPLGGYVKMLDEREGEVAPEELSRAFNRQSLGKRMAVVVAGPVFNLLFAVFAYWALFVQGVPGMKPILDAPLPNTPAALAGIEAQDLVRAVDGKPMSSWEAALMALLEGALDHQSLTLDVQSLDGRQREVVLDLSALEGPVAGENLLQRLGLQPWRPVLPAVIERVTADGAAASAGLRAGDQILRADGQDIADWDSWVKTVQAHPDQLIAVQIERAGTQLTLNIRPARVVIDDVVIGRIGAEVHLPPDLGADLRTLTRYGPLDALQHSIVKTWDMSILTLRTLWKMLVGQASLDNISGPISIAQYAGQSATIGLGSFLSFLAIVSISLGVLNLLPVPVLDGGHLMYYLIELLKGSPVSEQTEILGQRIGIALLFALMSLALFNDFSRLLR